MLELQIDYSENKSFRLLNIFERLNKGELLDKSKLANDFGVSLKTIQRDIDDLRAYLAQEHYAEKELYIKYDKSKNKYSLIRCGEKWLTNEEILALCKILLESRAFQNDELKDLINKLLALTSPNDREIVTTMIRNEYYNYVPLQHNKRLLGVIWELSQYINRKEIISFVYSRKDGVVKTRTVKPVAIMFSEFYFYLIAFMADDSKDFPTVFRIDRLTEIQGTGQKFQIPYRDKFNDGEFRKRVQFMYSGELQTVFFEYSGESVEAVLDRLPTAEIISEQDGRYHIRAEVYGKTGFEMWARSQGDFFKWLQK